MNTEINLSIFSNTIDFDLGHSLILPLISYRNQFHQYLLENGYAIPGNWNTIPYYSIVEDFSGAYDAFLAFHEFPKHPVFEGVQLVYYFPSKIQFAEADQEKTAQGVILGLDEDVNCWFLTETHDLMDYGASLLDTFLRLETGVPVDLAFKVLPSVCGNINPEKHICNCTILQEAIQQFGTVCEKYQMN